MEHFWVVTLFNFQSPEDERSSIEAIAVNQFEALGIEEYSLSEEEVDSILGERSYSGGDLPQEVLDEVEDRVLSGPVHLRFFFADVGNAQSFREKISGSVLGEVQIEKHDGQDWNAEWKKHYGPIKVNDLLEIVPSFRQDYNSTSLRKIFIYPGMGFGTGSHETTFLCLKLFTEHLLDKTLKNCLDFGSGSGILGLSVFKFFPDARVDFYDIDPEANKNCYQNAEINQLQEKAFRLLLPEVRSSLQDEYDLVFANILENILLQEVQSLVSMTKESGHLILSGLLNHQAKGIIDLYTSHGLEVIDHLKKGDWSAILLKKVPV